MNDSEFWKMRSKKYNNLSWVNDKSFIDVFIEAGGFRDTDMVLDIGTGTGVIAHSISPLVREVIGIDKSQDMLEHSNWSGNKYFIKRDIRESIFCGEVFDKITARLVFHHILEDTQKAMDECFRILKKGGKMILAEGVPPSETVKDDYMKIFKYKEERLTFMEDDLVNMMKKSGFSNVSVIIHTIKQMSVKNWLVNSGISKENQDKIFDLHANAGGYFKDAYNMTVTDDDCLIDIKNVILVGEK